MINVYTCILVYLFSCLCLLKDFLCLLAEPISEAVVISPFASNEKDMLSLKEGDTVTVYSKEPGNEDEHWGGKVQQIII